jgi:hypothetical protein
MASLLTLPIELIQHITTLLPCSAALNLLCVNRQLYTACNDRLVFRSIASHPLTREQVASVLDSDTCRAGWANSELVSADISRENTIRLAYAVERCIQASIEKDYECTLRVSTHFRSYNISNWLPHLMALHHPATLQLKPVTLLQLQGRLLSWCHVPAPMTRFLHTDDFINTNFALVYTILTQLRMFDNLVEVIQSFDRYFANDESPTVKGNALTIIGGAEKGLRQRMRGYGRLGNVWDLDQATALLPSMIFKLVAHIPTTELSNLPLPDSIPFNETMDIPPVFRNDSQPFSECHIRNMTTTDFLSGTWMGYYSEHRHWSRDARSFDPPMHDIEIVARVPSKEVREMTAIKAVIDRGSRGVDAHGEFSLKGHIHEDGFVRIAKRYIVHGRSWLWLGRVTPFGIVGVWGGYDQFGGHFWIWKERWSISSVSCQPPS